MRDKSITEISEEDQAIARAIMISKDIKMGEEHLEKDDKMEYIKTALDTAQKLLLDKNGEPIPAVIVKLRKLGIGCRWNTRKTGGSVIKCIGLYYKKFGIELG